MADTIKIGDINFISSGNRANEVFSYLSLLGENESFQNQAKFIASQGFKNVVVTSNPNDLPQSLRASMYGNVYGKLGIEISGVTVDVKGTSTAYVLLNNVIGIDASGNKRGIAAVIHELYHIGYTGTAEHPQWWESKVTSQLLEIDPNLSGEARSPYLTFDHAEAPKPTLNRTTPQNPEITVNKDAPYSSLFHIDVGAGVIEASFDTNGKVIDFHATPFDEVRILDYKSAVIHELYQTLLGRVPDADGFNWYMTNGMSLDQIRDSFVNSVEHRSFQIKSYYEDLLGREADDGGYHWLMDSGLPLDQIRGVIMASGEYKAREDLKSVYAVQLGRAPSEGELDGYTASGKSLVQIGTELSLLPEHRTFEISQLYHDLLGRDPDAGGLAWWDASGSSIQQIREVFMASPEYRSAQISQLYHDLLGRAPDDGGLAFYMNGGMTLDQIHLALASSPEHQAHVGHQAGPPPSAQAVINTTPSGFEFVAAPVIPSLPIDPLVFSSASQPVQSPQPMDFTDWSAFLTQDHSPSLTYWIAWLTKSGIGSSGFPDPANGFGAVQLQPLQPAPSVPVVPTIGSAASSPGASISVTGDGLYW